MSKEIKVKIENQSLLITPSRDQVAEVLSKYKVVSVDEICVVGGSWQVVAQVEAKPKAVAKPKASKPKAEAKPKAKKKSIGSDSE